MSTKVLTGQEWRDAEEQKAKLKKALACIGQPVPKTKLKEEASSSSSSSTSATRSSSSSSSSSAGNDTGVCSECEAPTATKKHKLCKDCYQKNFPCKACGIASSTHILTMCQACLTSRHICLTFNCTNKTLQGVWCTDCYSKKHPCSVCNNGVSAHISKRCRVCLVRANNCFNFNCNNKTNDGESFCENCANDPKRFQSFECSKCEQKMQHTPYYKCYKNDEVQLLCEDCAFQPCIVCKDTVTKAGAEKCLDCYNQSKPGYKKCECGEVTFHESGRCLKCNKKCPRCEEEVQKPGFYCQNCFKIKYQGAKTCSKCKIKATFLPNGFCFECAPVAQCTFTWRDLGGNLIRCKEMTNSGKFCKDCYQSDKEYNSRRSTIRGKRSDS